METRIQFRIDEETKRLAQQMAESQGRTLSDACRQLTEELAQQQCKAMSHNEWLSDQVNAAFEKWNNGESDFVEHQDVKTEIEARKVAIKKRASK